MLEISSAAAKKTDKNNSVKKRGRICRALFRTIRVCGTHVVEVLVNGERVRMFSDSACVGVRDRRLREHGRNVVGWETYAHPTVLHLPASPSSYQTTRTATTTRRRCEPRPMHSCHVKPDVEL